MADVLGLHTIENPSPTEYAVSLHLYTPPNAAMRGCHVFERESGERRHVMQGEYDSIRGVVPRSEGE
jgi:cysteine dioxygenase